MGDELGYLNDYGFSEIPEHASDNRWLHRPKMDWKKGERRKDVGTIESRIFNGLQKLINVRKRSPQLHAQIPAVVIDSGHPHIFTHLRPHPSGNLMCVYNFSEFYQTLGPGIFDAYRIFSAYDLITERVASAWDRLVHLAPYDRLWLVDKSAV
jgi:amylosucrase